MTCKTSEVAVCCSSASRVSVISRAFSIAMTAWAAKFFSSTTCLSENGRDLSPVRGDDTEQFAILAQGDHDVAVCAAKIDYGPKARVAVAVDFGIGDVVEEDEILAALNSSKPAFRVGMRRSTQELGVLGPTPCVATVW